MGYVKDRHEEIYETATNWEQGKTRFSIKFVQEAEKMLPFMPDNSQKNRLKEAIDMLKEGELSLVEPESVIDFLGDFREKHHHKTHG